MVLGSVLLSLLLANASAQDPAWKHAATMTILTTPEGADLPAGTEVKDFPLLVRLHSDFFDFNQAKADGADLRFSTSNGTPLAYQIEQWNAAEGMASIWVRIPRIEGNARQTICLQWGNADAVSESNGAAVFNQTNGYLSVWHMGNEVRDEVGTLESQDVGTTTTAGVVGLARHLAGGQGVFGGDQIPNYPSGASSHSTETWLRAEKPNGTVIAWGNAVYRNRDAEKLQIGYWGMELAHRLVAEHQIPICIINGAVGGTRVDQHQRNPENPTDTRTIYGRLLSRVQQARLTHGIRGILWHQGENDQGADGPTGGFGWETYRQYFINLAAAWKQDYPNVQRYYMFQIWPKACAMGFDGSDNHLREVQRTLPTAFSRMSIMSTLGIDPPGGCHYPAAGYSEIARLICPLVERDNYGKSFTTSITPPNLQRVYYASDAHKELVLEFDQPVQWDDSLVSQFYLDGENGQVVSGTTYGNLVTLKLDVASTAQRITYIDSKWWSQNTLLRGINGIAALTFCEVAILPRKPAQ